MKLSDKQKLIYDLLRGINPRASQAYLGALEVLEHDHKDKIHQSANSIRHALGLITRDVKLEDPKGKHKEKSGHKKKIRKLVDPLEGLPSELDFQIRLLIDEYQDWFVKVAHYLEFPTERQYRRKFAAMEEVLLKIMRPHFDVIVEIDKILANEKPSVLSFKKLEELIARDLSSYDHFFQNASSDWLPFLIRKGYLDNPKHLIKEGDRFRYNFVAPSRYISRIADKRPKDVLRLILNHTIPIREERNTIILENYVIAVTKMPTKTARKIVDRIYREKWLDTPYFSRLNELISDFMVKLSNDGYNKDAIKLGHALFDVTYGEPYPANIFEKRTIKDVRTVMDDYWYKEIAKAKLPILAKNNPRSLISFLTYLLNKAIFLENAGRNQKDLQGDTSVVWRPAIENHEQNNDRDFRSVIAEILRDTLESEGKEDIRRLKKHLKLIAEKKYPFFRRLEMHIYRMFPKQFKHNIEQVIIDYFDKWEFIHEYYHLIRGAFPLLSKKTKRAFFNKIESGPSKKKIGIWEENQRIYPNETIDLRKKSWLIDKLEPASSFLEGEIKQHYETIVKEMGIPEHPDFYTWHYGVHTAEPMTSLADNLNSDVVISFIKSYKIEEGSDFPFYDGTKEKFQEYVEKNPLEFSKRATELESADSIFSYALFSGLEKSVKSNKKIDWNNTLSLCRNVIELISKGTYLLPRGYDILGSIANLLEGGLKSEDASPSFDFRNEIWELLISLIPLGDSDESWEENYPDKNWDSIGISINTTSGKTFHAILQYALWCNDNLKKNNTPEFVPEVRNILESYFDQKIKNTISRHAVLGIQLPNLIYFDRDWTLKNLSKIFTPDNKLLDRAAWDAYLSNRVLGWVFKEIIPYYSSRVKNLKNPDLVDGRLNNLDENVIDHITVAYAYKLSNADNLFNELLDTENDLVLQHCAWMIGRILKEYKKTPNKSLDLDAIRKIWKESKLIRYNEIDWWFTSSPFDKNETMDLLLESLKKTDGEISFASTIEKELESYVEDFPLKTVQCLELIFKSEKNKTHAHAIRGITTRNLLKVLLQSKNQHAIKKTESLIHFLGTLGFNEYGDLLKK